MQTALHASMYGVKGRLGHQQRHEPRSLQQRHAVEIAVSHAAIYLVDGIRVVPTW